VLFATVIIFRFPLLLINNLLSLFTPITLLFTFDPIYNLSVKLNEITCLQSLPHYFLHQINYHYQHYS
jgi:hypothetical protein